MSDKLIASIASGQQVYNHSDIEVGSKVYTFYVPKAGNGYSLDKEEHLYHAVGTKDKPSKHPIRLIKKRSIPAISSQYAHCPDTRPKGFWSVGDYEFPEQTLIKLYVGTKTFRIAGMLNKTSVIKYLWFSSELDYMSMNISLPKDNKGVFLVDTIQISGKFRVLGDEHLKYLKVPESSYGTPIYGNEIIEKSILSFGSMEFENSLLKSNLIFQETIDYTYLDNEYDVLGSL